MSLDAEISLYFFTFMVSLFALAYFFGAVTALHWFGKKDEHQREAKVIRFRGEKDG